MLRTRFTDLVGCTVPIQQSPMGSFARPRLAAAVSAAGGLGMVVVTGEEPERIALRLDEALERSPGPIGANFFLLMCEPETLPERVATVAARAQVVGFFYRDPDPTLIAIVHEHGALASWQVGSREEARAAEAAGCDFVVAQGVEAGGHVRGRISLLTLLAEVLDAVDIPVLAAGGIGTVANARYQDTCGWESSRQLTDDDSHRLLGKSIAVISGGGMVCGTSPVSVALLYARPLWLSGPRRNQTDRTRDRCEVLGYRTRQHPEGTPMRLAAVSAIRCHHGNDQVCDRCGQLSASQ